MFIAFMGVPGCGKSATARSLADELGAAVFLEPEEDSWAEVVRARDSYGQYGAYLALEWFRNTRVPGYLKADSIHQMGGTAIVDSMYDKLIARYISDASVQWLIDPTNPYFPAARQLAEIDYVTLPDPTHVVFVSIDPDTWSQFISHRSREFDATVEMGAYLDMQRVMYKACRDYCNARGITQLLHEQQLGDSASTAHDVNLLISALGR